MVTWAFPTPLAVTAEIRYSVEFNTQHYGPEPIGTPGPYNSLNYGVALNAIPSAGADGMAGLTIINGSNSDGLGGFSPYARVEAVPEATTWMMCAAGLVYCLMIVPSRRRTSPQPPLYCWRSPRSP